MVRSFLSLGASLLLIRAKISSPFILLTPPILDELIVSFFIYLFAVIREMFKKSESSSVVYSAFVSILCIFS